MNFSTEKPAVALRLQDFNLEGSSVVAFRSKTKPLTAPQPLRSSSPSEFLEPDSTVSHLNPSPQIVSIYPTSDQVILSPSPLRAPAWFTGNLFPSSWPFPKSEVLPQHDDEGIEIMEHSDGSARSDGFKPLDDSPPRSRSRTSSRLSRLLGFSGAESSGTVEDSGTEADSSTTVGPCSVDRGSTAGASGLFDPDDDHIPLRSSTRMPAEYDESTAIASLGTDTFGRSTTKRRPSIIDGASATHGFSITAPRRPSTPAHSSNPPDGDSTTISGRSTTVPRSPIGHGTTFGASFGTDGDYHPPRHPSAVAHNPPPLNDDFFTTSGRFAAAGRPSVAPTTDASSVSTAYGPSCAGRNSTPTKGDYATVVSRDGVDTAHLISTDRRGSAAAGSSDDNHSTLPRRQSATRRSTNSNDHRALSDGMLTSAGDWGPTTLGRSINSQNSTADGALGTHPIFRTVHSSDDTEQSAAHQTFSTDDGPELTPTIPDNSTASRHSRANSASNNVREGSTTGRSTIRRASATDGGVLTTRESTVPSNSTTYQHSRASNEFTIFGTVGAYNNPMRGFSRSLTHRASATNISPNNSERNTSCWISVSAGERSATSSSATRRVSGTDARSIAPEDTATLTTRRYITERDPSERTVNVVGSSCIPGPPRAYRDLATAGESTESERIPTNRRLIRHQDSTPTNLGSSTTIPGRFPRDSGPITQTKPTITRGPTSNPHGISLQADGKETLEDDELFVVGSTSSDDGTESVTPATAEVVAPRRSVAGTSRTVAEPSNAAASQYRPALERLSEDPEPPTPSRFVGCHAELRRALDTLSHVQGTEITEEDRRYLSLDTSAPPGSSSIPLADMTGTKGKSGRGISGREGLIASRPRAPTTATTCPAASGPAQPTSPVVIRHGSLPLLARGEPATAANNTDLFPPREIRALWPGIDRMRNLSLAMLALTGIMLLSLVSSISVVLKGNADGVEAGNWLVVWATLSGAFFVSSGLGLAVAVWRYVQTCRRAEEGEGWFTARRLEGRPLPPTPLPPTPPAAATPPEAELAVSDQDRAEGGRVETLVSPAGEGEDKALPRADTQASILTVLCAAVTEGYSPLSEEQQIAPVLSSLPATVVSEAVEEEEDVEMF
ncbi:hypothetical protein QBC44DRAFT_393154 [Cladorrhinum sp. PSN332]|nr:hypothetical protein QBC44DRAFT_393154 [Cladorrhinum sp. PSN332]